MSSLYFNSSIQLVGELLFKIVGITAKADIGDEEDKEEEEDRQTSENSKKQLLEVLGKERRDRVLAAVYIVRQDPSGLVRKLSVHVWKALVHNTPRTVREMLPTLSKHWLLDFRIAFEPLHRSPDPGSHLVRRQRRTGRGR